MPRFADYPSSTAPNNGDLLVIKDVVSNNTKNITRENILKGTPLPADTVDTQAIDDDAVTAPKINFGGAGVGIWWEEIGRTTLVGAADVMTVSSLPARKYLKIQITGLNTGGTINALLQFNGDTSTNYSQRFSNAGAADTVATSATSIVVHASTTAAPLSSEVRVLNVASYEKPVSHYAVNSGGTGAGTVANRLEGGGKWANTSVQISTVTITNGGSGDYAAGSEVIVLGHN